MYRATMINIKKLLDDLWEEFNIRIGQIIEHHLNDNIQNYSEEIWKIYDEWWDYLKTLERVKLLKKEECENMIRLADNRCIEVIAILKEQ